jgi:hypothetical protein
MTGKYPYRLGYDTMPLAEAVLPLSETTIAQQLQLQGCTFVGFKTDRSMYAVHNVMVDWLA